MKRYSRILAAFLRDRYRAEKAYIWNFWAELGSTSLFVVTFILFSNLLFARIGSLAGYSRDEFLFMTLIGQATFYVWALVMYPAFTSLVNHVRTGSFDMLLLHPISAKFYMYASSFRPAYSLFVTVPNTILLVAVINWSNINVSVSSVLLGGIVWLAAIVILNTIMLLLASPVFKQGDASDMVNTAYTLFSITQVPYQKLPSGLKILSFTLMPTLLATAGSSAIALGKTSAFAIVLGAIISSGLAIVVFNVVWTKGINSYSSASS